MILGWNLQTMICWSVRLKQPCFMVKFHDVVGDNDDDNDGEIHFTGQQSAPVMPDTLPA